MLPVDTGGWLQDIGTLLIHFLQETGPSLASCGQNFGTGLLVKEGYSQWFDSQAPKLCVISHKGGGHLQKSGRVAGEWAARDGDFIKNVAEPIKMRFNQ